MSTLVKNIAPAMKRRRGELKISLEEVASRAGTSKSHIWELEQGRAVNPTILMLLAVSDALGMSLNALLGADVSQPTLSDDELELIQHHRRIFGRKVDARKFANHCLSLSAEVEYLQEATGELLDEEDAAMVKQISEEVANFMFSEVAA